MGTPKSGYGENSEPVFVALIGDKRCKCSQSVRAIIQNIYFSSKIIRTHKALRYKQRCDGMKITKNRKDF